MATRFSFALPKPLVACLASLVVAAPMLAQIQHPTDPLPSFEVATVKPWDGTGFGMPLRSYILGAFNLPPSSVTRVIGPDWISKTGYVIQVKPADAVRDAMQKMPADERRRQTQLMQQSLLADRFQLKMHFETREMPVYELVIAKGGSKLKVDNDPSKGSARIGRNGQMSELKGIGLPLPIFIGFLMSGPEIDGRPVIDKTGLAGNYDVLLDWLPSRLPAPPQPGTLVQPGTYGPAPTPDTEGPSLFTALQEQLGLKLVPAKGPVEIVVIDSIERPSEN
jgi:uncharacterized protein (TIGR03435 family)